MGCSKIVLDNYIVCGHGKYAWTRYKKIPKKYSDICMGCSKIVLDNHML